MTDDATGMASPLDDDALALLQLEVQRARQIDPACPEAAIHDYIREIAAAEVELDTVDLGDGPFLSAFSSSWHEESGP